MSTLGYIILVIILFAIAGVLDTRRQKRLGIKEEPKVKPYKPPKRRWPTERMYRDFYRTGDRRFLYDEHYKKKGYDDHNY